MITNSVMKDELIKLNYLFFSLDTLEPVYTYLKLAEIFEYKQGFDNRINFSKYKLSNFCF